MHIIAIGHPVVVIIRINAIGHAILVVVTGVHGLVWHTRVGVVYVISWVRGVNIGDVAVIVIVNEVAVCLCWHRIARIQRVGAVGGLVNI